MKENRAFIIFLLSKNNKKVDTLCKEFSWNCNTKCTDVPQPTFSIYPFSDVLSISKISKPPGLNQQNIKQFCSPTSSFKFNLKDTSFHFISNSLGIYFLPEWLLNLLLYIPQYMGNIFKFMVFTSQENIFNLGIFYSCPVPNSKLQAEFFENLFPQTVESSGENYDLLYPNSITKFEDDLEHIFCLICNVSKCDGFTVL